MSDKKKGLPVLTEEDADLKVQVKLVDWSDPDGTDTQTEVSEKLAHVRVHGENPAGTKTQLKLSETGAPNTQGDYDATSNTKPSSSGLIVHDRNATPDETHQNVRATGVNSSVDTDVWAQDVAMRDEEGNPFSISNPLPVESVGDASGDENHDFKEHVDVATGGTSTHEISVPDTKTFFLHQILADASSRFRYKLEIGDGAASEVFATKAVRFQSENNGIGADIDFKIPIMVVGTANTTTIRLTVQNRDNDDVQSIYSTLIGVERDT